MQEAAYATLTSQLHAYFETGKAGLTGPDRDNLAMDLTIQAVSGLIAATGFPEAPLLSCLRNLS